MINVLNCKNSLRRFFFVICMLCLFSSVAVAQITITGTVSDITGESMPGVSISLKGTGTGTMSDLDGHYSLSVPNANSALTFSFIGYVTQEITVGNKTLINVQMKEDIQIRLINSNRCSCSIYTHDLHKILQELLLPVG